MKFGHQLSQSLVREFKYQYLDYDGLKREIKKRIKDNGQWNEESEAAFVSILEGELDKVFTFQRVKSTEIIRRIEACDKEVEQTIKQLDSANPPPAESFDALEEEISDIIADVHDLSKFNQLNYTGFTKIIKKHDKQTGWHLKPIFAARLNAKPFYKTNYDATVVRLSKIYDLVRTKGNPVQGDSSAGGSQQNFVRQTTKYWVHPDNVTELKLYILKHLPVLVFNPNKEFEIEDSAITSIYFDNKELELYLGRLEKSEGAEALRLRWYGGMNNNTIFVERKTHREDWTGEKSVKARFPVKEKNVNAFLRGDYTVEELFSKARQEGKKSVKEIEELERLATEAQYTIISKKLKPCVRSFYNRTAFQLPGDARVRISLDTELSLVREDDFDGRRHRAGDNWRRMDIGVDWPFEQLPANEKCLFPYAVLEVKLQTAMGQEAPLWVRELVSSHLVEAVPKFSKFIHGVATLLPKQVDVVPYWFPQMSADIRKPATKHFGIEHPQNQSGTTSDVNTESVSHSSSAHGDDNGNAMDEEERLAFNDNEIRSRLYRSDANIVGDEHDDEDEYMPLLYRDALRRPEQDDITLKAWRQWVKVKRALGFGAVEGARAPNGTRDAGQASAVRANGLDPSKVQYVQSFHAPPGKRIAVPIRIEPKTYFALERTFLSYIEFAILIGTIAATLLNFAHDRVSLSAAWAFMVTAILVLLYSLAVYINRSYNIRLRRAVQYDDRFGPTAACAILFLSFGINSVMHFTYSGKA
ncbi:vacuolar transporter chaperone [Savitreella phatthalungensis]